MFYMSMHDIVQTVQNKRYCWFIALGMLAAAASASGSLSAADKDPDSFPMISDFTMSCQALSNLPYAMLICRHVHLTCPEKDADLATT